MSNDYYVYDIYVKYRGLSAPQGHIIKVGKGSLNRAQASLRECENELRASAWADLVGNLGVRIFQDGLDQDEAFTIESQRRNQLGRNTLLFD